MSIEIDLSNLSDNPEDLQKAFEQLESGATAADSKPAAQDTPPVDEPKGDSSKAASDQQQQQQAQTDSDEAAGVATKDGKHVIPYSVLQSARDRAARAEQIAQQLQDRTAALEAQLAQGSQGANTGESARTTPPIAESDLSPEDLEALKEDFPTVYKAVTAAMATAKALEGRLEPVAETVRTVAAERERNEVETVQDAIDANPKLAHVQATDKAAFDLAKQFDATLRAQPAWAEKPLAERFAKVTEMVESALGPIQLPAPKSSLSAAELASAARAKAAKTATSTVPTSLSEFPAGQHAAQDEQEAASQMTHLQLAEKFGSMTQAQMDDYFASL